MAIVCGGSKCNLVTYYSEEEDVNLSLGKNRFYAQTFTLTEETVIFRCRCKEWTIEGTKFRHYGLRSTDGAGKPTGPDLAHTTLSPTGAYFYSPGRWRRFDFKTFPTVPAGKYALIFSVPDAVDWLRYKLRADETAPDYPGGEAFISGDAGNTWDPVAGTDILFEVWGWTPPPEPPPEPAISNWAATDVVTEYTETIVTLVVTTNIPVHLWMRWTLTEPLKHPSEEFRRGILLMSGIKWCFVAFHENEQEEPGDTLVHTFIKPDWPVCQTRWFYFLGTKQAEETPSASPIFHYHHIAPAWQLVYLEPWTEWGLRFEAVFIEPWTHWTPPPPSMEVKFFEPWSAWQPPPFETWIFWEPWGTFLTQYNAWKYLNDPPQVEVSFDAGIITLTNHGHTDCGINFSPLVNYPIENGDGLPLYVSMNNIEGTANSSSTGIGLAGYFHHPIEGLLYWQLWISYGAEIDALCPYGAEPAPPWDRGWLCVGLGQKDIDLLALWKQWRTSLGKGTDPDQWTLTNFHFGLRQMSPEITDYLKNDYIGLYYSAMKRFMLEPWTS